MFEACVFVGAEFPDKQRFFGVLLSNGVIADAEVVFKINEQFLKARSGDIHELEFHLSGTDARFGAFGNVLLSKAGRLDHLVYGAVSFLEVLLGEAVGKIID